MEYETKQISVEDIDDINSSSPDQQKNNRSPIKYYLNIFKRRWLIILGFFMAGFIPAFVLSKFDPDFYLANFDMLLEPVTSEEQLTDPSVIARSGSNTKDIFSIDYPTILQILKGRSMLEKVANIVSQKYPQYPQGYIFQTFKENLVIERTKSGESRFDTSKIIFVGYTSSDPKLTITVLNTLIDEYLKYSKEEREKNLQAGVSFITEQIPVIELKINQLQDQQKAIQRKYEFIQPVVTGESLSNINITNKQELQRLDAQIEELTTLVNKLQKDLGLTPKEALAAMNLSQDPERVNLLTQLQQIESQIALDSAALTSTHPNLLNLKEQKSNLDRLLVEVNRTILRENNINQNVNPRVFAHQDANRLTLIQQLVETQNQLESLSSRYQSLKQNQIQTTKELTVLPDVIKEYENLQRQIELNTNILNQLSSQKEALTVDLIQKQTPWEILSQPQLPLDEYGNAIGSPPNSKKKLFAGSFAGLMLGLLGAIVIEKKRDVVYETSDLQHIFDLPILGVLPLYEKKDTKETKQTLSMSSFFDNSVIQSIESLNRFKPTELSTSKACLSEIYANLHFSLANSGDYNHDEVIISSLNPIDGQGYFCASLAKIAADFDRKVLLIDANNIEDEISYYLDHSIYSDVKELSEDQAMIDSETNQTNLRESNISLVTAGRENADFPLSLGSEQTQAGIKSIGQNYDMVLYNTSFFLEMYDVSLLAEHTQGIVMVVRLKHTPFSLLKEAVNKMNNYDLKFLGFVVIE